MIKIKRNSSILFTCILILLLIRAAVSPFILSKLNDYLAHFSKNYYAHIEDFDLDIWRGAYRFEKLKLSFKGDKANPFLTATSIDVSIAWRELFRGRILTDIVASEMNFVMGTSFSENIKKDTDQSKSEAQQAQNRMFPIRAERIQLANSKILYKNLDLFIDRIDGTYSNATPTERHPLSLLTIKGALLGKSDIKIVGTLNSAVVPTSWIIAAEMQKMPVAELNPLINRFVPLTFKEGTLDAYTEVKSENEKISGYVKPFLKQAIVIGDNKDFKGIKHFGIDITMAVLNAFFQSGKNHTVATKILFSFEDKKFQWNAVEALTELFAHGYQNELQPGIENVMTLSSQENEKVKPKDN